MSGPTLLGIGAVAAVVSCYFTAANYALLNYSRVKLAELFASRGRPRMMDRFDATRDELLLMTALFRATMNLVVLIVLVELFAPADKAHSRLEMVSALLVAAAVISVFGVAIPLSWARHAAEPILARSLGFLVLLSRLLRPLMFFLHIFDPIVRRLLGVPRLGEDDTAPVEQEILDAVSEGEKSGLVDEEQKGMIRAVVAFPSTTVEQIMTPRTDIEGIAADATLEDVRAFVTHAGHSRVPVYDGDMDHIVGVLYAKDLIPLLGTDVNRAPFDLRTIVREAVFIPETKTLRDLLTQFKQMKVHLAIVLDEYGGTAGLVTIEDLIEELVGEIQDEYEAPDEEPPKVRRTDDRTVEAHGRARIDELNAELGLGLPDEEDYDTLGGFVFATLGRVPGVGDSFEYENLRFTVTEAERTRVNAVRIDMLDAASAEAAEPMD